MAMVMMMMKKEGRAVMRNLLDRLTNLMTHELRIIPVQQKKKERKFHCQINCKSAKNQPSPTASRGEEAFREKSNRRLSGKATVEEISPKFLSLVWHLKFDEI
jgi:hypothetical protein